MEFPEALDWLYGSQLHGIKLGLSHIEALVDALGLPVRGEPGAPKFLHVAGTNGKGSVCAMLEAVCREAGLRTGLFISPHLVSFRERIRVDGQMISETEAARGLSRIREIVKAWEPAPTFFEIATALAFLHFQEKGAQIVVLETGMGGRLDSTNVVVPAVSVITPIALDHQQYLGNSLAAIAGEKAGIFKPGVPAVSAPQAAPAARVLRERARQLGVAFQEISAPVPESIAVGLAGHHQRWAAALAIQALVLAKIDIPAGALARGLKNVRWPGRFDQIDPKLILDGAHNPAAAERLAETWRELRGSEKAILVLGILKDKDVRAICRALLPIAARVIAVPVKSDRGLDPAAIVALFAELAPALPAHAAPDLAAALLEARTQSGTALVAGSLFLVGEAIALLGSPGLAPERSSQ